MQAVPLRQLFIESLTLPRAAARRVLGLDVDFRTALMVAVAAICGKSILGALVQVMLPLPADAPMAFLAFQPLTVAMFEIAIVMVIVWLAVIVGGWFGGSGTLTGSMKLMAWLQVALLGLQIAQLVLLLISPLLSALANLFVLGWFFWALSAFVAELHGFSSVLKVMGGIIVSFFVILFVAGIVLSMAGVSVPEMS